MKFYLSASQLPELAPLTRDQKKAVLQCAMEAFYGDQPSRVWSGLPWIVGGALGGALAATMVGAGSGLSHWKLPIIIGCGVAGAVLGTFVFGQFFTAQLRPYVRRVLEERSDEIARIK